jgi:integrase
VARRRRKRRHGAGSVYQRGGGGWRIRWHEGGRRRYASGYPSRELAEQVLRKILADIAAGRAGLPPDPKEVPALRELVKDWLKRRVATHRSARDDASRFRVWLTPFFGNMRPAEVTPGEVRRFVEHALAKGLSSTTVGHCVRVLSTFFTDLVERGLVGANPIRSVPRSTRRLYRNARDPKDTPFLERLEDIRRVFLALPEPISVAFAIGALAGLRTGEVLGLDWSHIDLDARRIMVRQQVRNGRLAGLKDDESRAVPLGDSLTPVLGAWKLKSGGKGLLFPPMPKATGKARFIDAETLGRHLRAALKNAGLPSRTWYESTRHSYASHFVIGGGSIERLRVILGHSSVVVTERYAHLSPAHFGARELSAVSVDMSRPTAEVVRLGCSLGAEAPLDTDENSASALATA